MAKNKKNNKKKKSRPKGEGNLYDKIFHENADRGILPMVARKIGLMAKRIGYKKTKMQVTHEQEVDGCYWIETEEGRQLFLHLEYQSRNDPDMVLRINYYVAMIRRENPLVPIVSIVVYVGDAKPNMRTRLTEEEIFRGFEVINAKDLDHNELLQSNAPAQVVNAILADYPEEQAVEVLHKITRRLQDICKSKKDLIKYTQQLLVLSFLRNLGEETLKIIKDMPVHIDIAKTSVFKNAFGPIEMKLRRELKEAQLAREQERMAKEQAKEQERMAKEQERMAKEQERMAIKNLLNLGSLSMEQIAEAYGVAVDYIREIQGRHKP